MSTEARREIDQRARSVVESVRNAAHETALGSHESALELMYMFVPKGPDDGPRTPIDIELLQAPTLTPKERLALKLGKYFFSDFNRNFGIDSNIELTWNRPGVSDFFENLAGALHSMLGPNPYHGNSAMSHLEGASEAYLKLLTSAQPQSVFPRA